jgi:hypothetical protein
MANKIKNAFSKLLSGDDILLILFHKLMVYQQVKGHMFQVSPFSNKQSWIWMLGKEQRYYKIRRTKK